MSVENDKEKILQILGRVSEKKKLDKLKQKYKELYDKVRKVSDETLGRDETSCVRLATSNELSQVTVVFSMFYENEERKSSLVWCSSNIC